MEMGRHRGMIANAHIMIGSNSHEKVKTFKSKFYSGGNKAGNSCYYSVQTLLSSRLLSKNLKIKIYKTIILPVVIYGCEI